MKLQSRLKAYYLASAFSLFFALIGFGYNTWRLEVTEDNSNIRMASFEILTNLSELEQVIYYAHYDKNEVEGNPRKGWVKVGMIVDLSFLVNERVSEKADLLRVAWGKNWETMVAEQTSVDELVARIDGVREEIKVVLRGLR